MWSVRFHDVACVVAGVGLRRRHQAYLFCACTRVTSGSSAFLFLFWRCFVRLYRASMADVNQRERYPQNVAVPSFRHKTSPDKRLQGRSKNVAPSSFPSVSPASLFVYMNFTSRACTSRPRTSTPVAAVERGSSKRASVARRRHWASLTDDRGRGFTLKSVRTSRARSRHLQAAASGIPPVRSGVATLEVCSASALRH